MPIPTGAEKDIGLDQVSTAWLLVVVGALGLLAGSIILITAGFDALFSRVGFLSIVLTFGSGMLVLTVGSILALVSRGTPQPGEDFGQARHRRNVATATATVGGVLSGLAVAAGAMLLGIVVGVILFVAAIIHLIQTCFESLPPIK